MNKACTPTQTFNSNETALSGRGNVWMPFFTLLLFNGDDAVAKVQSIRADDFSCAKHTADSVMATMPGLAGYQLWRNGRLVLGTYPQNLPAVPPPHFAD